MQIKTIRSKAGEAQVIVEDPKEHIQSFWERGQFFETRLLEYIYWHYMERVFVDVGSAIGNHTLFFAKFCQPQQVISIEPVKDSLHHQKRIISLNQLGRKVTFISMAVSDELKRGSMRPWHSHPTFSVGSNRLEEGNDIPVTTLDLALYDFRHINLMKIDVEGHELEVLKGAEETLLDRRPALFIEFLDAGRYNRVSEFLKPFGYKQIGAPFQDSRMVEFRT
jgi:FkbM family methyltransferase